MLSLTTNESIILLDTAFYTQADGVPMGPPIGTFISKCFFMSSWIELVKGLSRKN